MNEFVKQVFLVFFSYVNPLTIYWYKALYKDNYETAFYFLSSLFVSLILLLLVRKLLSMEWWKLFFVVICSSLMAAILLLFIGQVLFADRVFGFAELGFNTVAVYLGLSFFTPVFWINTFAQGALIFVFKGKGKPELLLHD